MTDPREGPQINRSCFGCKYLDGENYQRQGDSGTDWYCTHDGNRRHIADSRIDTPDWCPMVAHPIAAAVAAERERLRKEVEKWVIWFFNWNMWPSVVRENLDRIFQQPTEDNVKGKPR